MKVSVVNVSDRDLFENAKVRNKTNGAIKTIKSIPIGMTISEAVSKGEFDANSNIDFDTFWLNKDRFELVKEED